MAGKTIFITQELKNDFIAMFPQDNTQDGFTEMQIEWLSDYISQELQIQTSYYDIKDFLTRLNN